MEVFGETHTSTKEKIISFNSLSSIFLSPESFSCSEDKSTIKVLFPESQLIKIAASLGVSKFSVLLKAKAGKFHPRIRPFVLKKELDSKVPHHKDIDYVTFSRNGAITVNVKAPQCAEEVLEISDLKEVDIQPQLLCENISTRFILHKIHTDITLQEIVSELVKNNLFPFEIRRFFKKSSNDSKIPTKSVLVTIIGIELPKEIELWLKCHKVSLFIDKPRQCLKCWRFNHSTHKCKFPKRCVKCGEAHLLVKCKSLEKSCCNCGGNHFANDKNCLKWIEEKEFLNFKSVNRLPIIEARKSFADSKRDN